MPRPVDRTMRFEAAVAGLVAQAADETEGGILVFLPGEGEIRRVEGLLAGRKVLARSHGVGLTDASVGVAAHR